jgi:hypothetical protein
LVQYLRRRVVLGASEEGEAIAIIKQRVHQFARNSAPMAHEIPDGFHRWRRRHALATARVVRY